MKCLISRQGKVCKVSNLVAKQLVKNQGYRYISKQKYATRIIKEMANK